MRFQCPFCQGVVSVANSEMGADCQCGHCGEIVSVPTSRVATGAVISDFIILEELGRGGMGVVYLAHQITLDRPSAVKVLAGAYAESPEFVVDFIKEARAAAKLNHPHIVQAYAVGEDEGIYFFAMEHIDGETMKDYMKREGIVKVEFALEVVQQIAEALDYAWKEQRLVHRDIKPDNIMLTKKGRAKLADLGLARVAGDIDDADSDEVMGTPQYISPEHLTGAEMDVRSDIYSLGATLFHLITGRFAFEGRTATDIARKHLEEPLISPREINPKIPESVCRIIFKMMAKNVNERYQSAEDLVEDLRLARQGKKPTSAGGPPPSHPGKKGKQFSLKKGGSTSTGAIKAPTTGSIKKPSTTTGKISVSSTSTSIGKAMTTTGSHAAIDKNKLKLQKERKAKSQLVVMGVLVGCVLIAGIIFLIWNATRTKKKKPIIGKGGTLLVKPKYIEGVKPAVPKESAYIKAADKLLDFIKSHQGQRDAILAEFDKFFARNLEPQTMPERKKRAELMLIYVPMDEVRLKKAREDARRKEVVILQKRKDEMMKRQEEEARNQREKARLKELEERKRKVALEQEQKKKERLAEYIKSQDDNKKRTRYLSLFYSTQHKYKEAEDEFNLAIKEEKHVTDNLYLEKAREVSEWGRKMKKHVQTAANMWEAISNSGTKLKGIQIEIKQGVLSKLEKLSNGNVTVTTFDGKTVTKPVTSLLFKDLKKILIKAESKIIPDQDAIFHYLFCDAQFVRAAAYLPQGWKKELQDSAYIYAYKQLKDIAMMSDPRAKKKAKLRLERQCSKGICQKAMKALNDE